LLSVSGAWPWLALAGLGFFHGINPAMGWLFAVALGLYRKSERAVLLSLLPIAAGHAIAIASVAVLFLLLGTLVDFRVIGFLSGAVLIAWAMWHALYGHRHRVRIGMQTGLVGLGVWSFIMATAHGAGLMLIPALLPLCSGGLSSQSLMAGGLSIALAAVALHMVAMLFATGLTAILVYHWLGLAILKSAWINFDFLWTAMLTLAGAWLIAINVGGAALG
jgi:hypothetical protein